MSPMTINHLNPMVIALMGPTAVGKTALAIEAVQHFPLEIISVDSALIYRDMDIGTAKPSAQELMLAPHHLIDVVDPQDSYSCAQFCLDAKKLIGDIHERGRIPFLVGGTMLYFSGLFNGLSNLPSSNPQIRAKLENEAKEQGWSHMHARLLQIDPKSAARIHKNDPQRILRALEVYEQSGLTLSQQWELNQPEPFPYSLKRIVLWPENREDYKELIALRFHNMLKQGFVDEVKALINRGNLHQNLPSMRSVGYRQIWGYLQGEYGEDEMIEKGVSASRQLGKRQLTWLRKLQSDHKLSAYRPENIQIFLNLVDSYLN